MFLAKGISTVLASVRCRFAADGARVPYPCHIFEKKGYTFIGCEEKRKEQGQISE
jgi:hypothetical protein